MIGDRPRRSWTKGILLYSSRLSLTMSSNPSVLATLANVIANEGDLIPKERLLQLIQTTEAAEEQNSHQEEQPTEQIDSTRKVLWAVKETAITIPDSDSETDGGADAGDESGPKAKKKKARKDALLTKKSRSDPNAPPVNRIPLPELRDAEKLDKMAAAREATKRLKLGPEQLPSICLYTLLNGHHHHTGAVICASLSEDSSLMAVGLSDSTIKVWALTPTKLKKMRSDLDQIDRDADDVLYRMMDESSATDVRTLKGHSGPVYSVSFSPDRTLLLSCSEDSTIRLWSLQTWTNLCVYKGHCYPVWDVQFSPHGYYFASASLDRTARLWATDQHQPLRLFVGHLSDVDCVAIHPNSNYVASGSSDFSVRLWDVLDGSCLRSFRGHRGKLHAMIFSNDGRFLVTGGTDRGVFIWDLASGTLALKLLAHYDSVYSLCFSRDAAVLATGGADDVIHIWDLKKLLSELDLDDISSSRLPVIKSQSDQSLLGSYRTKSTKILALHFSRKNLLLAAGTFH